MEQYFEQIPYFLLFVVLGIAVNLLRKKAKGEKLPIIRIVEEIAASLWIALVVVGALNHFTDWSYFLICGVASISGYFNSTLIDKVGRGIIEYLLVKAKQLLDILTKRMEIVVEPLQDNKEEEIPDLKNIKLDEEP